MTISVKTNALQHLRLRQSHISTELCYRNILVFPLAEILAEYSHYLTCIAVALARDAFNVLCVNNNAFDIHNTLSIVQLCRCSTVVFYQYNERKK